MDGREGGAGVCVHGRGDGESLCSFEEPSNACALSAHALSPLPSTKTHTLSPHTPYHPPPPAPSTDPSPAFRSFCAAKHGGV